MSLNMRSTTGASFPWLSEHMAWKVSIPRDQHSALRFQKHWHKQAEWSYMLNGRARITAVDQDGRNFVIFYFLAPPRYSSAFSCGKYCSACPRAVKVKARAMIKEDAQAPDQRPEEDTGPSLVYRTKQTPRRKKPAVSSGACRTLSPDPRPGSQTSGCGYHCTSNGPLPARSL